MLSTALVKKFIAHSDLENLEQVVLSGHGHVLIGETAADSQIRAFIKATPTYLVSAFTIYVREVLVRASAGTSPAQAREDRERARARTREPLTGKPGENDSY